MWVVKLGGSMWDSPLLREWLERLSERSRPVVVVPGGGPFADQVRTAQACWRFDDDTAHVMALHAMEQMARMYCVLQQACVPAESPARIKSILACGGVPVWLPTSMALSDDAIERDWSMTSDSLALWLAQCLKASGVLLVKSASLPATGIDVSELQHSGLVDRAFIRYRERLACPVKIVHRGRVAVWPAIEEVSAEALAC